MFPRPFSGENAMRSRLSSVDTAWLRMDRPENLMVITGALWFEAPMDWERFEAVLRRRVVEPYAPFRSLAVPSVLGPSRWREDPDFDLGRHLHRVRLEAPGDEAALMRLVTRTASRPLPRSRPLWEAWLVDGYGGGSAVVVRLHHCIADGMTLARLLLTLTDVEADADLNEAPAADRTPRTDGLRAAAGRLVRGAAATVAGAGLSGAVQVAAKGAAWGASAARLLLLRPDPKTSLRGELAVDKRLVWTQPLPLTEVKDVARRTGSTVNDVLVAAVAGALRSWLVGRGGARGDLRAVIPFNLRAPDAPLPQRLGNRFGLVFLPLPVRLDTPAARLDAVRREMGLIKASPDAPVSYTLLSILGLLPPAAASWFVDFFTSKASLVLTNVPGPRQAVFVAGRPAAGLMAWVPQSGGVGVGVSIISYDGVVRVGLSVDEGVVPDPEAILASVEAELAALGAERRPRPAAA